MTKSWAWVSLLLLLAIANAAVIPGGNLAHTSTPSTPPSLTESTRTLAAFLKQWAKFRGGQVDLVEEEPGLEALHGRQQDGPTMDRTWARQHLAQVTTVILVLPGILTSSSRPSAKASLLITTLTLVRTVTVELASQTTVVLVPVEQTLIFISPVLVIETRVVTAPRPSRITASRDLAGAAAFDQVLHPAALPVYSLRPNEATLLPKAERIRRQESNPVTRVSTIIVEITTTLTNVGSSIRTVTILNPVFVSVSENQTVTTTKFTATTLSTETTASRLLSVIPPAPPAVPTRSTNNEDELTDTTASFITIFPTGTTLSPSTTKNSSIFTSVSGLTSTSAVLVPSETSTGAGFTTWFSTPSDTGVGRPTQSTAKSYAGSKSASTTTTAPSGSTALPNPESASDAVLPPGTVAIITIGAVTALIFFLFLGFFYQRYRTFFGNRRHHQLAVEDYQMTSATAATAIMNRSASAPSHHNGQDQIVASETSSKSEGEGGQVRIVIRPVANQRDNGSGVSPLQRAWPRPPGYTGQTYSFSADGSGETTPRDATGWSTMSEYGSTTNRDASQGGDLYELAATGGTTQRV
ncbi:gmc oxidoreductase [Colletotrichum incanum]|uniref:Gmc oxidoreductase n=1 Tax=Colletotrichum incanum TaxID=1573173 RepID=A0A166UQ31_COLIC|nr:gmc oxidoreductase [Colletotrichum incanum]